MLFEPYKKQREFSLSVVRAENGEQLERGGLPDGFSVG